MNVFSVRLVSALAGVVSSFFVYLLMKDSKILKKSATKYITTFLFILSPWVIFHSRVGYELTLGFMFFVMGVWFFSKSIEKLRFLKYSVVFLTLATYTAYTYRFIVPMFLLIGLVVFKDKIFIKKSKNKIFKNFALALFLQIPHLMIILTPAFFPKWDMTSESVVFSQALKINNILPYTLSYSLAFAREFFSQFTTYFSPQSLFFLPDPDLQRSLPELSVFYFWMVVPYFLGLLVLWREKRSDFVKLVIILAVISPVPAALTRDPFSTHRAFPLVLPLIMIIGLGMDFLARRCLTKVFYTGFIMLTFLSLVFLWRSYFVILPKERAIYWGWGFDKMAYFIKQNPDYNYVIDQSRQKLSYPQLAFFMKYDPVRFQKDVNGQVLGNYYHTIEYEKYDYFGNVKFRNIIWEEDIYENNILVGDEYFVSEAQEKEHYLDLLFEIKSPINEVVLKGYKTNPQKKCLDNPEDIKCR